MSLNLNPCVSLESGINQAIRDENQLILETIQGSNSRHEKIHEVRKSLKKLRAVVRLVRKTTDRYAEENIFYRDLGRKISGLRDLTALLESLDRLVLLYSANLYKKTFRKFREQLADFREKTVTRVFRDNDLLDDIAKAIQLHLKEYKNFEVKDFSQIAPGIRKVYKRGKKSMQQVIDSPSTENFHDWRKRTKYLRYQLEMLMHAWPSMLSAFENSLHTLSDNLGDDHDLDMLQQKAEEMNQNHVFKSEHEYELLRALISFERSRLQNDSITMGRKIFYEEPDDFTERLKRLWEIEQEKKV